MQSIYRFFNGPTPEERVRAWKARIRSEQRLLDREMRQLDMAVKKVQDTVKQLANKGDVKNARTLAIEIVRSNKQKDRLSVCRARLGSINTQLDHQLSMYKVTGSLQKSTEIMKHSNALVKLPQIRQVIQEVSMEMMKAGIMEEMLEDTMNMEDDDELELQDEADEAVNKVLYEITEGKLGEAGAVQNKLPPEQATAEEEEQNESLEGYRKALGDLLSSS